MRQAKKRHKKGRGMELKGGCNRQGDATDRGMEQTGGWNRQGHRKESSR